MWIGGYSHIEWLILSFVCLVLAFLSEDTGSTAVALTGTLVSFYIWLLLTEKVKGFDNKESKDKNSNNND